MRFRRWPLIVGFILVGAATSPPVVGHAQALGEPDRGSPGDEMIQEYLKRATDEISARYSDDVQSLANWEAKRPHYVEQYAYMLGLSPRTARRSSCNPPLWANYRQQTFAAPLFRRRCISTHIRAYAPIVNDRQAGAG